MPDSSEMSGGVLNENRSAGFDRDIEMFFTRNGFNERTREECDKYARLQLPSLDVEPEPSRPQGYCSYTLSLPDGHLLQFRPEAFTPNMDICSEAKAVFGIYAPATTYLGLVQGIPLLDQDAGINTSLALHVYLQEKIPGIPLSDFRRREKDSGSDAKASRRRMVEDLAMVFALSFRRRRHPQQKVMHPEIPKGKVGGSMNWRLNLLKGLSDKSLARQASEIQQQLEAIEESPWALTHGDLLPGNIMVDPTSGHLTGLIDWAEAEWLPFGMALYGVEEVLSHHVPLQGTRYYEDHDQLRHLFWSKFISLSEHRDLGARPWLGEIELSRRLGILLWRGIAFDDGRIDRVVEAGREDVELQKLQLFLDAPRLVEGLRADATCGFWGARRRKWSLVPKR